MFCASLCFQQAFSCEDGYITVGIFAIAGEESEVLLEPSCSCAFRLELFAESVGLCQCVGKQQGELSRAFI